MSVQNWEAQAEVGARLRRARRRRGLSLYEAAEKSGKFTAVALGAWERGDRAVKVVTLLHLADLYQIPASSLLPGQPVFDPQLVEDAVTSMRADVDRLEAALKELAGVAS